MVFGAALPLLGLLADAADGVDAVVDLGETVADGKQQIELGAQILVAGWNARVFAYLKALRVRLIADLETHLIATRRSDRPIERVFSGYVAFDLHRVRIFQIPDEAVAMGILGNARVFLFLFLLTPWLLSREQLSFTAFGARCGGCAADHSGG